MPSSAACGPLELDDCGSPPPPDAWELPTVKGPVVLTLAIALFVALIEQPQGHRRSNVADVLQIAYVPFGLCVRLTGLLAATCATVMAFDVGFRQLQKHLHTGRGARLNL